MIRIYRSLGIFHCNFCLNLHISHGDMKENVSECFFSEHSVYNTNGLVILEMHEQRLSNDTKTMSLQTWRTTTRNEASCHRKNASHNYTLWRCVWKMTGKMRDEGLQCQIVPTSHWPIFANPRRHTSLRAVAYLCVSVETRDVLLTCLWSV